MNKANQPKVFISYAWTYEYTNRVAEFATRLISDGIDVLFDKFEMTPGKELIDFMEKSVKDPSVTNVLILLNPHYKKKADSRVGGVGTETQIISSEIYNNLEQTKFIPVIFDIENDDFTTCKPIYLRSRVHVNLSDENEYEINYRNLVKILYGEEIFKKPILGNKPYWIDHDQPVSEYIHKIKNINARSLTEKVPNKTIEDSLFDLKKAMFNDDIYLDEKSWFKENFYNTYLHLLKYRNDFLEILNIANADEDNYKILVNFFEDIKEQQSKINYHNNLGILQKHYLDSYLHEIFIYTIGYYLKFRRYQAISYLVYRSYITYKYGTVDDHPVNFKVFFYSHNPIDDLLKNHFDARDNKTYFTGKGMAWIENIYEPLFSKIDFINADVLLSNLSILLRNNEHAWFAKTYVYVPQNSILFIQKLSVALKSEKLSREYFSLLKADTLDELKENVERIENYNKNKSYHFGYSGSFDTITLISDFINIKDVAKIE